MPTRRYTEEQFRTALEDPAVRTMADLCRALGIVPRGANYETVRAYAARLRIDLDRKLMLHHLGVTEDALVAAALEAASMGDLLRHFDLPDGGGSRRRLRLLLGDAAPDASKMPVGPDGRRARRSYTDEELLEALDESRNYSELCERLGLRPISGTHRRLREHAARLGTPIPANWSRPGPIGTDGVPRRSTTPGDPALPRAGFDPQDLRAAVAAASSIAQAIRGLGHEPTGATRKWFARDVRLHDIDISHFPPATARGGRPRRPIERLLVRDIQISSNDLRHRLLEEGIKQPRCEGGLRTRWEGRPMPLELDHIDGDRTNNLLENIRLLCPNCHASTPTYRGRNIGRRPATSRRRPPNDDEAEAP
jgi:hypothetical protein